jgi:3-oxo-5-alpha-steroid 4-dehydrogenase 1
LNELTFYHWLLLSWFFLAAAIFALLFFINAPYGRYVRTGWGPVLNNRLAWVMMESVAALGFVLFFVIGRDINFISWVFLALWEAHYVHRAFIYPLGLRGKTGKMPLMVVLMGLSFNSVNAYLNGRYLFTFSAGYNPEWLRDPRFIAGALIFLAGFVVNRQSDNILRLLRKNTANGYAIPQGGFYRWISCPNYLGEITIWVGWAVATWSLPGLAFALWTAANLAPRARANHEWYKNNFDSYPKERKALLPRLW